MTTKSAYLARRMLNWHDSIYKGVIQKSEAMKREYAAMNKAVNDELARLYAQHSVEGKLSLSDMYEYGRLKELNAKLVEMGRELGGSEEQFMTSTLGDVYKSGRVGIGDMLSIEFPPVHEAGLKKVLNYPWSGANFSSRIWDNKTLLVKTLREELTRSFSRGTSFADTASAVDGIMGAGFDNALRLIRTEAMFVLNQSQIDAYTEAGFQQIEWVAADDDRLCEECAALDGTPFELGQEEGQPLHPNCRCTYVPLIDTQLDQQGVNVLPEEDMLMSFDVGGEG